VLDSMVIELVEKETLNKPDLERILANVRKRPPHNTFAGFGKRTPSDKPPVEIPVSMRKPAASNGSTNGTTGAAPQPTPGAPVGPPGAFGPAPGSGNFGPPPQPAPYGNAGQSPYGGYAPPPSSPYDKPGPPESGGGQGSS